MPFGWFAKRNVFAIALNSVQGSGLGEGVKKLVKFMKQSLIRGGGGSPKFLVTIFLH